MSQDQEMAVRLKKFLRADNANSTSTVPSGHNLFASTQTVQAALTQDQNRQEAKDGRFQ